MDYRAVAPLALLLVAAAYAAAACGDSNGIPPHSAADQKAIDAYNSMTVDQKIAQIQNGPMPAAAKAAMIKKLQSGAK